MTPGARRRYTVDATELGGVVGDRAAGSGEPVVAADAGGECEEPGCDAWEEVAWRAGAVAFEQEEVFAGPEDRLDPLPDRREMDPSQR